VSEQDMIRALPTHGDSTVSDELRVPVRVRVQAGRARGWYRSLAGFGRITGGGCVEI
jgi:hypothetical protein